MPKVSFVVPYYNKLDTIKKCVGSLLDQSEKEVEVLVVFDGPDPEALEILEKMRKRDRRISLFFLPERRGAPAARNFGLKQAKGEYVSFWDADSIIESGAVRVWLLAFAKYTDVDFVYASYQFEEGRGGVLSLPFDPWLLEVNNYISGHFPIKRSKCPQWDESLKSLQDWDFWLQAVRAGCKGKMIQGYAFRTKSPDANSISGTGCTPENWLDRLETVKKKHNIPIREICVSSLLDRNGGIEMAKILGADYRDFPNSHPHRYKVIIQIGFHPARADEHANVFAAQKDVKKVLFWSGSSAMGVYSAPFIAVEALAATLNDVVSLQFCEDKTTRDRLERLGFKNVEVLLLPIDTSELVMKPLPEKFSVLIDVAREYDVFFSSIARACPDIEFKHLTGVANIDDSSAFLTFHADRSLTPAIKRTLIAGRWVISNVAAPYCGYVSDKQDLEKMRAQIIRTLRELQDIKELNLIASQYYKTICSAEGFKVEFEKRINRKPEVVPA